MSIEYFDKKAEAKERRRLHMRQYMKMWRKANPDKIKKYRSTTKAKERKKAYHAKWISKNRQKWNLYQRQYRVQNLEKVQQYYREYHEKQNMNPKTSVSLKQIAILQQLQAGAVMTKYVTYVVFNAIACSMDCSLATFYALDRKGLIEPVPDSQKYNISAKGIKFLQQLVKSLESNS